MDFWSVRSARQKSRPGSNPGPFVLGTVRPS